MIEPTCWVRISGAMVTGSPSSTVPVVLSGVEVTWGRADVLGQADPATARLEVFDPTARWATGVDSRSPVDLIGDSADIGWAHAGTEHPLFRGRVVSVTVAPERRAGVDGALIALELASRVADLGGFTAPARPVETIGDRTAALEATIKTLHAAGVIDWLSVPGKTFNTVGDFANHLLQQLAAIPAGSDTSVLAAVAQLYDASASKMTFLPDDKIMRGVDRRAQPVRRGLAGLVRDPVGSGSARAGAGAYIASHAITPRQPQQQRAGAPVESTRPLFLDGATTGRPSGGWVTRRADQRITSLELTYRTGATGETEAKLTRSVTRVISYGGAGPRVGSVAAQTMGATDAGMLADDYADLAKREAADWVPAPVVLDTGLIGGFETLDQALELLAGGETSSVVFLQRTDLPRLGIRPVFCVMGATISHRAGAWVLSLQLGPVHTEQPQHPISWDEVDSGDPADQLFIYADGTTGAADGLHESVTCEDFAYCSTGLGVSSIPADSGWDTLQ